MSPDSERLPLHWESMLRALGLAVKAEQATLSFQSLLGDRGMHRINIRIAGERRSRARLAVVREPASQPILDSSGWIVERANGSGRTSHLCAVLWQDAQVSVQVDLIRKADDHSFGTLDILTLQQIAPGLSLAMRAVMDCVSSSLATDVFRRLPFGVALLDTERRILFQNAAMRGVLTRRDNLSADQGVLRAASRVDQENLVRCVRQITSGETLRGELMVLPRESGGPPYLATVERFEAGFMNTAAREPVVRLTVVDPEYSDDNAITRVAAHFNLTPTEIDVVQAMLLGLDVAECATRLDLAVNTIRWHQKRIFAKTGTSGRSALILLFIRGSQLHGA
ncbi:MAG: helix-turn-helix transcriptional regulator [Panacagrimonas sp.]